MRAALFEGVGKPLRVADVERPMPHAQQVRLRVRACGVCRTDLHIIDGELDKPKLPLVLGHQIVGIVDELGPNATCFRIGDRVGVPWLGWTDGTCRFCTSGRENLCDAIRFTGYDIDGGFADYCVADERYCFSLPPEIDDLHVAPLLCAGLIGYRAYKMAGDARRIGIFGFGSAAHIVAQIAVKQEREVFAFTRPGDHKTQAFARELGAVWAGDSNAPPPRLLDAALIFAPAGELVPLALRSLDKGGTVVCGGIHMSDIPSFPYDILWNERSVRSVANLTRADGNDLFDLIRQAPVRVAVTDYTLEQLPDAVEAMHNGRIEGSAVISLNAS